MACTVTTTDITQRVKQQILDVEGVTPFNTFVFEPYTAKNPDSISDSLAAKLREINISYQGDIYGNLFQVLKEEYGTRVEIVPSEALADAMTTQNFEDEARQVQREDAERIGEEYSDDYIFSPREENAKRPVTDNYTEYIRYKKAQLDKVKNIIKKLNVDKRDPKKDTKSIVAQLKRFNTMHAQIQQDIETLEANEIDLMFHAIDQEIREISAQLDNVENISSGLDIEDIKSRLNFLFKFIKGTDLEGKESDIESLKNFNHPDFAGISTGVDNLRDKYRDTISKIVDNIIEQDVSYATNVKGNDRITEEQLREMFNAKNDINWLEKTFLGISSSSENDTILPQILKSFLETKESLREAEVKRYKDRLNEAIKNIDSKDFDFIFERTARGTKTGNIINITTPLWKKGVSFYLGLNNRENLSTEEKYRERIKWLKDNTEVIDFRKLKAVKELYGDEYQDYFIFSDEEMDSYEKQLQDILGPLYQDEIDNVLNNLEIFQGQKYDFLSDTENRDRFKNVARVDPWAFIKHYNGPGFARRLDYPVGSNTVESVYSGIQHIRFIPKKEIWVTYDEYGQEVYKDTGYYNQTFDNTIKNDPAKLEYWKIMREIYQEYINPVYGNEFMSDMSYAKFEEGWVELLSSTNNLQKGSNILKRSIHEFKSFFYERGQVRDLDEDVIVRNYTDSAQAEFKKLSNVLKYKSLSELQDIARDEDIDPIGLEKPDLVKEIALKQSLEGKSDDINKVTGALLDMAAIQRAKQDTLPIANLILDAHKIANPERKNSIEKLTRWIDRVIKNRHERYRGTAGFLGRDISKNTWFETMLDKLGKVPFINRILDRKSAYLLSDNEKKLMKYLEDLKEKGPNGVEGKIFVDGVHYELKQTDQGPLYFRIDVETNRPIEITEAEYDEKFRKDIENKIQELGLDLNAAGMIQGILKIIIVKGLGLNPISGIFNRIEGKNSGIIMDKTGKYWTPGNINIANSFMAFSNFLKILPERLRPDQIKKVQELEKFKIFLNNVNLIQDRKNELERQAEKSESTRRYLEKLNIYQFAVDNPEFKNQGAILLSILMDTTIQDTEGNSIPIFDGKEFTIYNNEDGKLVLKDQFRTPENIKNWEDFDIDEVNPQKNQYFTTRLKMKQAISQSQGNYDNLDMIDATRNIWGRSLMLFKRWMPEHFMQRFSSGKGFDIFTGQTKLKGRYRYLWENHPALFTSGILSIFVGLGATPVSLFMGAGFTGFVAWKYFQDMSKKEEIQREINNTQEFIAFLKSVLIETLNYPLEVLNIPKSIKNSAYAKTNLTKEEAQNLTSIAKELGIKLTTLALLLMIKRATWDEDDDKDSKKRQFHNFVDNQLNRNITALSNWTNPNALIEDVQRVAFVRYLGDLGTFLTDVGKAEDLGDITEGALKVSPVPRLLYKGGLPWQDEKEYDNRQWEDRLIKNLASEGEWEAEQRYRDIRQDRRDEIRRKYLSQGLSGQELRDAVNKEMREQMPRKKKGESYKEVLKRMVK